MKCEQPKRFFQQESRKKSRYNFHLQTKSRTTTSNSTPSNSKDKHSGMPFDSPMRSGASRYSQQQNRRQALSEYNEYYPYPYTPRSRQCKPDEQLEENESWACDYCRVATFKTYREACDHERVCPFNQQHQQAKALTTNPHSHSYSHHSNASASRHHHHPFQQLSQQNLARQFAPYSSQTPRLLLSMPSDKQSLSDRQCYVRSHFVEIFEAGEAEVDARHSKGAQKLQKGQVGLRCIHCVHLFGKARAERATCYPSSVSRIYQTVADMQRFHFEACMGIPAEMKVIYKTLKTTRPRGQGSPQSYWISSAKAIGLVDTESGIRLRRPGSASGSGSGSGSGSNTSHHEQHVHTRTHTIHPSSPFATSSASSIDSGSGTPLPSSPRTKPFLPPLSPGSQLTTRMSSDSSMSDRESDQQDATMLLALRGCQEKMCP